MLENFNSKTFLKDYWQKKPLLIRQALPFYQSPITAEELAGLACEVEVESRIINESDTSPHWTLEQGPFKPERFSTLPDTRWTLLIQGINKLLPEFNHLLNHFNFIPSWRIDDVMASYAVDGGSVGPHTDQYDVFLLQGYGKRKWMIEKTAQIDPQFIPGLDVKVLEYFKTEQEWILEPGDILYLPPGIAHHGIAIDECITFSIGFRAPSYAELLSSYLDTVIDNLPDNLRYTDPPLSEDTHHGEISRDSLEQVQSLLKNAVTKSLENPEQTKAWFGHFVTEYLGDESEPEVQEIELESFLSLLKSAKGLYRPPEVRASFIRNDNSSHTLYINGQEFCFDSAKNLIIEQFCDKNTLKDKDFELLMSNTEYIEFVHLMYQEGYIELLNDD